MICGCKIDSAGDIHIYLLSKICCTVCLLRLSQKYSVFTSFKYQEREARNKENFIFGLHLNSVTNIEVSRSVGLTWKKCLKSKASNESQMKFSLSALSLCEWLIKHMYAFLIPPKNSFGSSYAYQEPFVFPCWLKGYKGEWWEISSCSDLHCQTSLCFRDSARSFAGKFSPTYVSPPVREHVLSWGWKSGVCPWNRICCLLAFCRSPSWNIFY